MTKLFEDNIGNGATLVSSYIKSVSAMLSLVSYVRETDMERHFQAENLFICESFLLDYKIMQVMEHSNT